MSNIDKQALNQEKIEWLNKLADMEYCKSNPGHWLMSLKDTNMLAKLALRSVALLDELEAKDKSISFLKDQLAQLANFNPDWDKLEAATDSLREHMAELTAARKRIAELERKEQHSDRQSVIDALASSGEEWSDIEEYMQKWDAERAAAAGKGE
ncbi:ead/Ea22-like family protein [Enterobacter kobei]|uniref:ead/Ea22-like family protein n=1 Tax=Enterobacter kobei TaxID=208224 RepID=UPI002FD1FD14